MPRPRKRYFVDEDTGLPLRFKCCFWDSMLYMLAGASGGMGMALRSRGDALPEVLQILAPSPHHPDPLPDIAVVLAMPMLCALLRDRLPLARLGTPLERLVLAICVPYTPLRIILGWRLWPLVVLVMAARLFLSVILYLSVNHGWQPTREAIEQASLAVHSPNEGQ